LGLTFPPTSPGAAAGVRDLRGYGVPARVRSGACAFEDDERARRPRYERQNLRLRLEEGQVLPRGHLFTSSPHIAGLLCLQQADDKPYQIVQVISLQRSFTAFTAPEVFQGNSPTAAADVYAFGYKTTVFLAVFLPYFLCRAFFSVFLWQTLILNLNLRWILWETMARNIPYEGRSIAFIRNAIVKREDRPLLPVIDSYPEGLAACVRASWGQARGGRPRFAELKRAVQDMIDDEPIPEIKTRKRSSMGSVVDMMRGGVSSVVGLITRGNLQSDGSGERKGKASVLLFSLFERAFDVPWACELSSHILLCCN
jgi:hypothetical protein